MIASELINFALAESGYDQCQC